MAFVYLLTVVRRRGGEGGGVGSRIVAFVYALWLQEEEEVVSCGFCLPPNCF